MKGELFSAVEWKEQKDMLNEINRKLDIVMDALNYMNGVPGRDESNEAYEEMREREVEALQMEQQGDMEDLAKDNYLGK